jgi:hypothetical protein
MTDQMTNHVASVLASSTGGDPTQAPTLTLGAEGTDALLFKDDNEFWFEISRLFGAAEYGGAMFGEVIAIAKNIKSGDYDSWYDAHSAFADRLADEAEGQLKKGHKIRARDHYLRASNYYRSAEFFLHANPHDPRVKRAFERTTASYRQAAALFTPAIEAVEIPYEGTTLPGYFHPADQGGPQTPLILPMPTGPTVGCRRLRWRLLDAAASDGRHFSRLSARSPMPRMPVEADIAGIDLQNAVEHQLCVPAVSMISALWTRRSISETTQAALGNTSRHSARGRRRVCGSRPGRNPHPVGRPSAQRQSRWMGASIRIGDAGGDRRSSVARL